MKHVSLSRLLPGVALCVLSISVAASGGLARAASAPPTSPQPGAASARPEVQALWEQVTRSEFILQGASDSTKKATLYAFFDPNCIFCHLSWELSRHYYQEGLQVRWIPIAFLMTDSAPKAAWVLLSADPPRALSEGEGGWEGLQDGGGAFKQGPVTAEIQKTLARNKKLFIDLGWTGTPGFVYKDAAGIVHTASGVSSKHMFANMVGLRFVPVDDPDLEHIPD
jgi:thiol:disulfide interchange protein DsbG